MRSHSHLLSAHYLRRVTLWLLGRALPDANALRKPARMALVSVVVAAAAGTLLALCVVGGLVSIYLFADETGLSSAQSLGLVSGIGFVAALLTYLIARQRLNQIPDSLDDLRLFQSRPGDALSDLISSAVAGFFEGTTDKADAVKNTQNEIVAMLDALMARLDAMEADKEVDVDVVFEMDPHSRRRHPTK